MDGFQNAGADEGTLWIADLDESRLVPIFNSGPESESFVDKFRQPLDRGVVSMVFHSGQPFCENEVFKNSGHDDTVDKELGQVTAAMIALPLFFAHEPRGVISCVKLGDGEFDVPDLNTMQHAGVVLERLLDWSLLRAVTDLD
ncbi:MAG: GAF domain-containing protein [Planctomycetota bacterium]